MPTEPLNPFVEAPRTAHTICLRLGWKTGDDQPRPSRELRGLGALVLALYAEAEREGCLDRVVANLNRHVRDDATAQVRETAGMLGAGYGDMLALFRY